MKSQEPAGLETMRQALPFAIEVDVCGHLTSGRDCRRPNDIGIRPWRQTCLSSRDACGYATGVFSSRKLEDLYVRILGMVRPMGLLKPGTVSLDGTGHKALSQGHANARGAGCRPRSSG